MKLKKYKLGDLCTFVNGRAYLQPELQNYGKYKIVRVGNLSGGNNSWYYSDMELEPTKYCAKGDLLYAWACNFGPYIWKGDKTIYHYHIWKVINSEQIDKMYLYYLLKFMTNSFMGCVHGSTMLHITKENMESMEVRIHASIEEQRRIATILNKLDCKIELNRQINDNLEAMAKQLYDYWFVQFDFPNEEGKPYKSSGGAMLWNEKLKREIPLGWSVLSVNDIAASVRGVSYAKDDMVDSNNGVLVLRGNNIQDNRLIYDSNVAYIPSSFVSENQRIRPLDIIMTMSSGSKEHIGKSAMFQFASEDTFGAFLTKFTAKEHCAYLLFNLFNSKYFKAKIKSIACGTGINNLTNQTFDEIYVVMPEDELLLEFDKRQSQIFAEIGLIGKSNIELTKQRDELLPLLMNGQASVNYHLSAFICFTIPLQIHFFIII